MKSLNTKLVLSALGIALLATPAFAAKQKTSYRGLQNSASSYNTQTDVGTYPNGAAYSGSILSREEGERDNVIR
jgi:hypothetical protein